MARRKSNQPLTQFAQVGVLDLRRAIRSGRREGRRGLHCPGRQHFVTGPQAPEGQVATTPYIQSIHQQVNATCGQLAEDLYHAQQALRDQTYRSADGLVRLHDAGRPTRAACGRFSTWVSRWNGLLHGHQEAVYKTVNNANYLITRYWEAVQATHRHRWTWREKRRSLCRVLTPALVAIDPSWTKPDHFLLMLFGLQPGPGGEPALGADPAASPEDSTDGPTARAAWVLRRALELMSQELKYPYPDDPDDTEAPRKDSR